MSRSNTLAGKAERRAAKAARTPLPAYVDLVEWIKARKRVSTRRAEQIILAGALRVDGKVVGVKIEGKGGNIKHRLDRCVPAGFAPKVRVADAATLERETA